MTGRSTTSSKEGKRMRGQVKDVSFITKKKQQKATLVPEGFYSVFYATYITVIYVSNIEHLQFEKLMTYLFNIIIIVSIIQVFFNVLRYQFS